MVELRWKKLPDQLGPRVPNEVHVGEFVPGRYVLQYRVLIPGVEIYGPGGRPTKWSDWRDVPVSEE